MPNGMLRGFAISTLFGSADHTYVTSDAGRRWRCHGRSAGGIQICEGTGNEDQAVCLAQPDGDAGIAYLRTGVCHQIANRILSPAGIAVSSARGIGISIATFGAYGLELFTRRRYHPAVLPWPELELCRSNHEHP